MGLSESESSWISNILDGIDVGLVASESLCGLACADVPKFGGSIACARNK